ncbi:hypothetical protein FisN_30Hh068 [Fistulifera solaris]|uniref:F-box domain-containing protein n=1 Tax=Fistulifera solaris TaxID=1519565 RepID=A0A1Z5K6I7_FISSO|nr:hypothetical protein FisN_30Hh068 [Fistulifera solaris]|eukprot:GAX21867.1 hypothetical protein FisN_30Hh068 [Fistulifera solaris]
MSTEIHEDPNDDSSSLSMIPSLLTLPFDCRIAILQCVPNLSDIACTCRQLRHERNHPSLDPTRTVTVRFRGPTSGETLVQSLKQMKEALGKTGFPLELQLTGSPFVIPTDFSRFSHFVRQWSLPQVRLLDLSNRIAEDDEPKRIDISVLMFLAMVLPNLLEIACKPTSFPCRFCRGNRRNCVASTGTRPVSINPRRVCIFRPVTIYKNCI